MLFTLCSIQQVVRLVADVADLHRHAPRQRLLDRQAVVLGVLVDAVLVDRARRVADAGGKAEERLDQADSVGASARVSVASAGVVDRREHVVVLARTEEHAEAAADDRVVVEPRGRPGEADARSEVVVVRLMPPGSRRAEAAARDPPDLVAAVLLDGHRVELVAQTGVDGQVRPPLDVVLDVADVHQRCPCTMGKSVMLKLSRRLAWKFARPAEPGDRSSCCLRRRRQDAADLAAELDVVPAADDEVAQDAERAAFLDGLLRPGQGVNPVIEISTGLGPVSSVRRFDWL